MEINLPNMIILIVFGTLLLMTVSGALGMWVAGEKGQGTILGFVIGAIIPIFGVIGLMVFMKTSDAVIVTEMYDRKMMGLEEYEETMEFKIIK